MVVMKMSDLPTKVPSTTDLKLCERCGNPTTNADKVCDHCKKDLDTDRFVVVP